MSQITLAIAHLRHEQMYMRQGGLYWVAVDQAEDAAVLAIQCLAAMPAETQASLMCCGHSSAELAQALAADTGPAQLNLFDINEPAVALTLKSMVGELTRAVAAPGHMIVLMLPASAWQSEIAPALRHWCQQLNRWLARRQSTLLVLSHGQAPRLHERLLGLNESLSGLAQLFRSDGGFRYQLHYWHSGFGVCSGQELALELDEHGFTLSSAELARPQHTHGDDQRMYLAQRAVLDGSPMLSQQWRLFDSRDELLLQARKARAASVIVAIESNQQVEGLARQLHDLRQCCGNGLKIIVRELEPCLRYRDERLLVSSGANITVPYGTTLAYFFSIIDSMQGQTWRHTRHSDFEELLERLRPPAERGLLSPAEFLATVTRIYGDAFGEISHQLLKLTPRGGLEIQQYLNQISLRRFGEIACVVEGDFYLFLFACRADSLEPALGNICRLAWRDLFSALQILTGVDELSRAAFLDAAALPAAFHLADEPVAGDSAAVAERGAYVPQRSNLLISEVCP